jgi:hypothetical protein
MELRDALSQISEIRQQMARTELFRGYRAVPIVFSGMLAFVTAGVQLVWLPVPWLHPGAFLTLWISTAVVSVIAIGCEMTWRQWRSASPLENEKALLAIGQFVPPLGAGALVMLVLLRFASEALWMLPGLWSVLFSLAIFASVRFLPSGIVWVAAYYLAAGLACLAFTSGAAAFAPWSMAIPFGGGQLLTASVLYWTLERPHEQE